jgi:hypothetical protein
MPFQVLNPMAQMQIGAERQRQNELARRQEIDRMRAEEQASALRNYLQSADLTTQEAQNKLFQFGQPGADIAQRAATIGKERRLEQKTAAEMAAAEHQQKIGALNDMLNIVSSAEDPESYALARQLAAQRGYDVSMIPEQYSPKFVATTRKAIMSAAERATADYRAAQLKGEELNRGLRAQEIGLSERRADTEERRLTLEETKASPEYQSIKLDAKEQSKREAAFPKAQAAYNTATREIDTLVEDLKALKAHPGLANITGGIEGRLPSVGKKGTAAQALLDKILAKGQFRSLQELRNASPTGGAVGNVSDAEGKALRDSFGALNQAQGMEDFQNQIDRVISDLQYSKGNIKSAYDETYSYRKPAEAAPKAAPKAEKRKTSGGTSYDVLED